jgi:outer membrane protein TolC
MKWLTFIAILVGFFAVSLLITRPALTDQQNEKKAVEPAKLEQLQKERIDALEMLVKILTEQYKVGTVSFTELSQAHEDLIEAKLDATDKPNERFALLEQQLMVAQEVFEFIERSVKVDFKITEADYQRAKAHRLAIEIKLTKERDKANPAG